MQVASAAEPSRAFVDDVVTAAVVAAGVAIEVADGELELPGLTVGLAVGLAVAVGEVGEGEEGLVGLAVGDVGEGDDDEGLVVPMSLVDVEQSMNV